MKAEAYRRGTEDPPERPIFILGCPRSGTTLLFTLLSRHEALRSMGAEGHVLWNAYQHPRLKQWSSDRAAAADIREGERKYLYTAIRAVAGDNRFIDKTPKNALKLPYLAALFPGATFVFLKRDGRATVSSLIEGWRTRRGLSYRLPIRLHLADYRGRLWSYILPPEWRSKVGASVGDVAALQYVSSNEIALSDRGRLPQGSFVGVSFEELLARPVQEASRLMNRLELPSSEAVLDVARNLHAHQAGAITPPRPGKWRDREQDIARLLPQIQPTMAALGYETEV